MTNAAATPATGKRPRFRLTSPTAKQIERATRPSEIQVHTAYVAWVRRMQRQVPELARGFHPANGELRDPKTAAKLQRMGVRAGVLDWFLPCARHGFHGLWIEFKRPGAELSKVQLPEVEALGKEGYFVHVFSDWEAAAKLTLKYLSETF